MSRQSDFGGVVDSLIGGTRGFERRGRTPTFADAKPLARAHPVEARQPDWVRTKPDPGEGRWILVNSRGAYWDGSTRCDVPMTTLIEAEAKRFSTKAAAMMVAPEGFVAEEIQ